MIENRFKRARTEFNQHGFQSTQDVYKQTGITKSLIEDLENGDKNRKTAYQVIAKLAKHYGVSVDYLAGNSDEPSPKTEIRAMHEYTGLSGKALMMLHYLNSEMTPENHNMPEANYRTISFINRVLEEASAQMKYDEARRCEYVPTLFSHIDEYINLPVGKDIRRIRRADGYTYTYDESFVLSEVLLQIIRNEMDKLKPKQEKQERSTSAGFDSVEEYKAWRESMLDGGKEDEDGKH